MGYKFRLFQFSKTVSVSISCPIQDRLNRARAFERKNRTAGKRSVFVV